MIRKSHWYLEVIKSHKCHISYRSWRRNWKRILSRRSFKKLWGHRSQSESTEQRTGSASHCGGETQATFNIIEWCWLNNHGQISGLQRKRMLVIWNSSCEKPRNCIILKSNFKYTPFGVPDRRSRSCPISIGRQWESSKGSRGIRLITRRRDPDPTGTNP